MFKKSFLFLVLSVMLAFSAVFSQEENAAVENPPGTDQVPEAAEKPAADTSVSETEEETEEKTAPDGPVDEKVSDGEDGPDIEETESSDELRLGVLLLETENVDRKTAENVSGYIREAASKNGLYKIIDKSEMDERASLKNKSSDIKCYHEKCLMEASQLFVADKIISGTIEKDGALYILKATLFSTETADFAAKVSVASECQAKELDQLASYGTSLLLGSSLPEVSIKIGQYKGKQYDRQKEWYLSAGASSLIGLAWMMSVKGDGLVEGFDKDSHYEKTDASLSSLTGAFPDRIGYGGRARGMGGAYTALSDDAPGIIYNPAGLVRVKGRSASYSYLKQFNIQSYNFVGFAGKITRTRAHGQAVLFSGDELMSEATVITSYAHLFENIHKLIRPVSAGINVKFRMASFKNPEDYNDASVGSGSGLGLDLGMQTKLSDRITFGLVMKDIFDYISYTNDLTEDSYTESVPMNLVIGGHYKASRTVNLVLDGRKGFGDSHDNISLGGEKYFFNNIVALRTGLSHDFSFYKNIRWNMGGGINYDVMDNKNIGLDYAFEYSRTEDQSDLLSGIHRFSLNFRF
ncbi:MAG: hypothetical protein ACLFQK_02000 [Fibrobacterota bacterium]